MVAVVETLPADLLTPLAVYLLLAKDGDDSFLFESVEGGESVSRYSFIGSKPQKIVTGDAQNIYINDAGTISRENISIWDHLKGHFALNTLLSEPDLPSFTGGAVGCFGFSCCEIFEPALRQHQSEPNAATVMFYDSVVAFDHAKQIIQIITLVFTRKGDESLENKFSAAKATNQAIRERLEFGKITLPKNGEIDGTNEVISNWKPEEFKQAVKDIKELIAAGECYQVVLSQRFSRRTDASPVSIYRAMRSMNPSPYMFLIRIGTRSIIGSSPEMLVRCEGETLEYRPIAGTRKRGADAAEDATLAEEMRADAKEVSEHLMLVDLGRNDLGRVAEFGSVKVSGLMSVEKFSHVQHLVSYLSAKLKSGSDRFDAFASCFPAGTVSGAPKIKAIEIIRRLEPTPRGIYSGAIGYFDHSGNMDTCIAIRTMVLENGVAAVQAGAGIVADSDPEKEFVETVNKAKALLKAIDIAETGNL